MIYLDGDIVVTGDISELYDYPLKPDKLIGGVRTPGFSTNRKIRKEISGNGLDFREYINAGILIFNSRLLREENFKPFFLSHTDKQYSFQDQDILNYPRYEQSEISRLCYSPYAKCIVKDISYRYKYNPGIMT